MKSWIVVTFCLLISAPLQAQELSGVLTTSGRGQVAVQPDMVTVTVGVESEAKTAAAALSANTAAMQAVFALLDSSGVAARDLQTSQFSVSPVWDNSKASLGLPLSVRGFVASNLLSVKVRRIDGLGAVLDALVSSGANRIQGVRFGLADPAPHLDRARRLAVAEAIRKARLYAEAAGVTLGDLLSIDDTGAARVAAPFALEARAMAGAVPIAEGELVISAEVTLRFALE